jgi:hypothetical protein
MSRSKEYLRGAKDAAAMAGEYDGSSTHPYRLEDCILGKLNIGRRAKPRKNPRKVQDPKDAWSCGFGLALAEVNRAFAQPTTVRDVARAAGFTGKEGLQELKRVGLDSYDLKELKKCLK